MINRQKKGLRYSEVYKLRAEDLLINESIAKYMKLSSLKWLKEWIFPLIIFAVTAFIAFKNYTPNTYLTGWDNLHPEFNFKLNIERSLNAVWQEYQGVGLLGGMSHAADLPRQLVLSGLAVFMPINVLRYFWTFLMLFIGPLGVYFLLKTKSKIAAFTASMFYLFNLATVQYFFVPFETFVSFYGFLPWLLYFAIDYLNTGKKIWKYALISLLATTAFYVQTLFVVYGIFLTIISFKNLKRSLKLFLVTFLINAFWLLPVVWFTLSSGQIPSNSEINLIASPETVLMNQGRSNFSDIVNLKGYWFDYYDFGKDQKFDYLFRPWIDNSARPYLKEIGIGLFVISILGFVINRQIIWLVLLGIGYLMLSGFKIPIAILEEAFRNSFTKWSVAFSFIISVGLGYFVAKFKKFAVIPSIIIIFLSIYSVYPIFNGKLISERVKVSIPNAYFESFDWFNAKSDGGRVAYFPAFDKWGWNYHDWGYGGSGFIWYGIKNPVLDRAFNVWSPNNENYYNEVTRAILAKDVGEFERVINKYQVKYLLLDESIINPGGEKIEVMDLGFDKVFNSGFLTIYDTHFISNNFISSLNSYTSINADLTYSKVDPIYQKYGDYVQDENGLGLPFVNFDNRGPVEIRIGSEELIIENKKANAKVTLPITEKITESFASDRGYSEVNNCDLMKKGGVERSQQATGRQYMAKNGGVACDYFVYENLKYNQAYVMHVKGENKEGRSLKIYLYNWESKRVEIEELLPVGQFDSYFVIYPKTQNSGYTLNIETRSFGRIASENIIEKIEFVPFDINLVNNLYIEPKQQGYTLRYDLEVKNIQKYGTAIYKVETTGSGILELGQGYESGWISYPKLEHLKVNGWANGWVLNANSLQSTDYSSAVSGRPSTVVIFYWPQFLEWFGFVVLCIVGIGLTFGFGGNKEVNSQ